MSFVTFSFVTGVVEDRRVAQLRIDARAKRRIVGIEGFVLAQERLVDGEERFIAGADAADEQVGVGDQPTRFGGFRINFHHEANQGVREAAARQIDERAMEAHAPVTVGILESQAR